MRRYLVNNFLKTFTLFPILNLKFSLGENNLRVQTIKKINCIKPAKLTA